MCREREGERDVRSKLRGEGGSWWRGRVLPIGSPAALSHLERSHGSWGEAKRTRSLSSFFRANRGEKSRRKAEKRISRRGMTLPSLSWRRGQNFKNFKISREKLSKTNTKATRENYIVLPQFPFPSQQIPLLILSSRPQRINRHPPTRSSTRLRQPPSRTLQPQRRTSLRSKACWKQRRKGRQRWKRTWWRRCWWRW